MHLCRPAILGAVLHFPEQLSPAADEMIEKPFQLKDIITLLEKNNEDIEHDS